MLGNGANGKSLLKAMLEHCLPGAVGATTLVPGAGCHPTRESLLAGLLREVSCCSYPEIAELLERSTSRVRRLCRLPARCLRYVPPYAEVAVQAVEGCLELLRDR